MPEPSLKPKPKKPKLDEDNLLQSDRALNFIASVSIALQEVQPDRSSRNGEIRLPSSRGCSSTFLFKEAREKSE